MRKFVKASFIILPCLWSFFQFFLRLFEDIDFVIEKSQNPGWLRIMIEYIINPAPAYIQGIVLVSASVLLYFLYIKNKSTQNISEVKSKEGEERADKDEEIKARKPVLSIQERASLKSALVTGYKVFVGNKEGCSKAINCRAYLSLNAQKEDIVLSLSDFRSTIESRVPKLGSSAYTPSELDKWLLCLFRENVGIHLIGYTFTEIRDSQICWAEIGNPQNIDIGGGEGKSLEVCRVIRIADLYSTHLLICIPTHTEWNHVLAILKGEDKEYKGELIIRADNANMVKREFTIAPNHGNNDIQIIWS